VLGKSGENEKQEFFYRNFVPTNNAGQLFQNLPQVFQLVLSGEVHITCINSHHTHLDHGIAVEGQYILNAVMS
jgi:hypothetical protein